MPLTRPLISTLIVLAVAACSSDGGSDTEASVLDGAASAGVSTAGSSDVTTAAGATATTTPGSFDDSSTTLTTSTTGGAGDGGATSTTLAGGDPVTSTATGGTAAPSTATSGGTPTTAATGGGATTTSITVVGGPAEIAYCNAFIIYNDSETLLDDAFGDEATEPTVLGALFADYDAKMAAVEAAAPPAVDADIALMAGPRRQLIQLLAANDYDIDAVEADPVALPVLDAMGSDELVEAELRVRTFNDDVCGLDLEF
jgi:hypothetical protein